MENFYNNSALLDFLNRGGREISVIKSSISFWQTKITQQAITSPKQNKQSEKAPGTVHRALCDKILLLKVKKYCRKIYHVKEFL